MKLGYALGLLVLSAGAYAASNHNPASVGFVNAAIETAFQSAVNMTTYSSVADDPSCPTYL